MKDNPYNNPGYVNHQGTAVVSEGKMSKIMTRTFLFMFLGLAVSSIGAAVFANLYNKAVETGDAAAFTSLTTVMIGSIILELVFVIISNIALKKNQVTLGSIMFFLYAAANGITLSSVLLNYEIGSVINCFVGTAVVFVLMAAWGAITKKNLSGIGNIGLMLLFGIIVMSLLNVFLFKSNVVDLGISVLGLAVFIGLTAYDTQKIKEFSMAHDGYSENTVAMFGAMMLYLDFINMFLYIVRLFGKKD